MNHLRVWLFRGLVLITAGLMVVSFILPWWAASCVAIGENVLRIYPYGLYIGPEMEYYLTYITGAEMPGWFAPLMWTYLGICIVALLYSTWAGEREIKRGRFKLNLNKLIIGVVGLSYILVAVLAVIVAAIQTGDYGVSLLGSSRVMEYPHPIDAEGVLQFGYYMAYGVGLLCITLALLRDKIVGKTKLNA